MKPFWMFLLVCALAFQGCGKKAQEVPVVPEPEAAAPAELPVLEQNKVAPNPSAIGFQDSSFEPVNDDQQKSAPADELADSEKPAAD